MLNKYMHKRGVLAVEMAVMLPFLLYMLLTFMYVCMYVHDHLVAVSVVREAGRLGVYEFAEVDVNNKQQNEAEEVITKGIKERCADQMYIYHYSDRTLERSGTGNRILKTTITLEIDEDRISIADGLLPKNFSTSYTMEVENHRITRQ